MFKKVLSLVVAIAMLCSLPLVTHAEAKMITVDPPIIQPLHNYTQDYDETISITNGIATCKATLTGISGTTTKVVIKMTLQKKTLLWWSEVETWSTTSNTYYGTLTKTAAVKSGTYRVKAVYTVYSGSNSESITDYSAQKSY